MKTLKIERKGGGGGGGGTLPKTRNPKELRSYLRANPKSCTGKGWQLKIVIFKARYRKFFFYVKQSPHMIHCTYTSQKSFILYDI